MRGGRAVGDTARGRVRPVPDTGWARGACDGAGIEGSTRVSLAAPHVQPGA